MSEGKLWKIDGLWQTYGQYAKPDVFIIDGGLQCFELMNRNGTNVFVLCLPVVAHNNVQVNCYVFGTKSNNDCVQADLW